MGIVSLGKKNFVDGKEVDLGCTSHQEVTAAAAARSTGVSGMGFKPTVGVMTYFSFSSDTAWFVEKVAPMESQAAAIRDAVDGGVEDEALIALAGRSGAKIAKESIVWVQAMQVPEEVQDRDGALWPPGSWLVRGANTQRSLLYLEADLSDAYRQPTTSETKQRIEGEEAAAVVLRERDDAIAAVRKTEANKAETEVTMQPNPDAPEVQPDSAGGA